MKEQKKSAEQRTCKTETISTLALQYFQALRSPKVSAPVAQ